MEELKISDIIKDRYRLLKFLGNGSFGEVWLAHDKLADRNVALKIYLSLDPSGIEEFQREFSNLVDVVCPYLLTPNYFDVYDRRPFLVMKYCEKGSSSKLVGRVTEEQLWQFIYDVASGLSVLHSQADPIVHQDIKPDNILIDRQGRFLITDFGVSKRLRATMCRQSKRDIRSGAMPYMAPERFDATPRLTTSSDIWSLGASIYELATGELPFCGFGGSMQRNGADMPTLGERYSVEINSLMQKCLALSPSSRPSAAELKTWANARHLLLTSTPTKPINEGTLSTSISHDKCLNSIWKILVAIVAIGIALGLSYLAKYKEQTSDTQNGFDVDSVAVRENEIKDNPVKQILNSQWKKIGDSIVHFYDGAIYYGQDVSSVKIAFVERNASIVKAIYKNVAYGGMISMTIQSVDSLLILIGKDGDSVLSIQLSASENERLLGKAIDGSKEMKVRLIPANDGFDLSDSMPQPNPKVAYTLCTLGNGYIKVPDNLTYKGETDDGGPYFSDDVTYLYAMYIKDQDLDSYYQYCTDGVGGKYITYRVYKDTYFVLSGYSGDGKIFYTKAVIDNRTMPSLLYTATLIYPVSKKTEFSHVITNIFNKFPFYK